jgi:hypothetical protein
MRRCGSASNGKTGFFENEGVLLGVYLGADYAAEHEWGIKGLCELFGISGEGVGVEKRVATVVPPLRYEEKGQGAVLVVTRYEYRLNGAGESEDLRIYKGDKFAGAWCDEDFGIHVKGKDNVEKLRKLHEAIQNKNVLLYIGGNGDNPFSRGGLVIAIRDVYPAEWAENMRQVDEDQIALTEAAKATGIRERVCANLKSSWGGLPFYALSPRWRFENDTPSAHKVIFWLNPCDQNKLNYGWFTVEELDQWIEGKGPIPKTPEG